MALLGPHTFFSANKSPKLYRVQLQDNYPVKSLSIGAHAVTSHPIESSASFNRLNIKFSVPALAVLNYMTQYCVS